MLPTKNRIIVNNRLYQQPVTVEYVILKEKLEKSMKVFTVHLYLYSQVYVVRAQMLKIAALSAG